MSCNAKKDPNGTWRIEPLLINGIGERTDDVAMVTKRIAESYRV